MTDLTTPTKRAPQQRPLEHKSRELRQLEQTKPEPRQPEQKELSGALHLLGRQLVSAGRFDEARESLKLSLDLFPGQAGCHFDLGNVFYADGRIEEAVAEYRHAVRCDSRLSPAWYNMGVALMQAGRFDDAEHAYRRTLRFSPNQPETHNNLGILLQSTGRWKEALQHYRAAARLRPGFHEPRFNLGCLLQDAGKLEEARVVFEALLTDCPHHTEATNNLANVLTELAQHKEARARYEAVLERNPEHALSRWNLGLNQLRTADWPAGWKNYEWRLRQKGSLSPRSTQPRWSGEKLNGARLLLTAEQGMGDLLQFVRFIKDRALEGGRVTLECHRPLVELFRRMPELERVIEVGSELPEHDVWLPLMSLPNVLGTTIAGLPASESPYLGADQRRVEQWRQRLAGFEGLRVGLAWSGNAKFRINAKRSMGSRDVRALSRLILKSAKQSGARPVHLFSLQKGVPAPPGAGLIPLGDDPSSMDDLAGVMMNLDLILTVDTSVAHLAGALGRPVWTMLAFHADWRWMTAEHSKSPWYPTMRLLRQKRQGDWSNVVAEVQEGINGLR